MGDSCGLALRAVTRRRLLLGGALVAATTFCGHTVRAQLPFLTFGGKKDPNQATSSRSARKEVTEAIPWEELDDRATDKLNAVLDDVTIYRRLPTQTIECDAALYRYMIANPDLVVNIWAALGISSVALERQAGGGFLANDGEGTRGRVEFLYAGADMHIVYASGKYEGPLFHRPVRGNSVMILRSEYLRATADAPRRIRCKLDVFVRLEHAGVEMLAKTFQPLVDRVADHNFKETTAFLASLSYTAASNPPKIDRITTKLVNVPDDVRNNFTYLCDQIAVEATLARNSAASTRGRTATLDQEVRVSDGLQR